MRGRLFRPAGDEQTEVSLTQTEPVCHLGRTPDGRAVYRWRDRTYVEVKLPSVVEPESSTNEEETRVLIDQGPAVDDVVVEAHGVRVLLDTTAARVLAGAQVDYVNTVMGQGFAVRNPNAVSTCGCGHSYKTADDAGAAEPCGADGHGCS